MSFPIHRPRRLRGQAPVRDLVHEVELSLSALIQPYFLKEGPQSQEPISGFADVYRWGVDTLSRKIETDLERGLKSFLLFGKTEAKDAVGSAAYQSDGLVPTALKALRTRFGKAIVLFTDVCLCPFTSHGHCGVLKDGEVENDASLELLSQMALSHARAGADFVAPSDMMDGRVGHIRKTLDERGLSQVGILSYTAKYASNYYGPFREALSSAPQTTDAASPGMDRTSYQMDFRNRKEALLELKLDTEEGADMVMVKPALAYLDIIALFKAHAEVPVVAYSVSGEYQMVKLMAREGLADERKLVLENLSAIKRAGAQAIITYSASEIAEKKWF